MTDVRGQYPPEFELRAVAMMTDRGLGAADVSRQLGVSQSRLHEWKKAVREKGAAAFPGSGHQAPLEEENRRAVPCERGGGGDDRGGNASGRDAAVRSRDRLPASAGGAGQRPRRGLHGVRAAPCGPTGLPAWSATSSTGTSRRPSRTRRGSRIRRACRPRRGGCFRPSRRIGSRGGSSAGRSLARIGGVRTRATSSSRSRGGTRWRGA